MFPKGEFSPVRGYANMMRKMGLRYDRIDINEDNSHQNGVIVPIDEMKLKLISVLERIADRPSCLLRSVDENPYLH